MAKSLHRFRLSEISGVDRPAQPGACVIIQKRADDPTLDALVANARAILTKGPSAATYTAKQLEEGMLALAAAEARANGTTPERELANAWSRRQTDIFVVSQAWDLMQTVQYLSKAQG